MSTFPCGRGRSSSRDSVGSASTPRSPPLESWTAGQATAPSTTASAEPAAYFWPWVYALGLPSREPLLQQRSPGRRASRPIKVICRQPRQGVRSRGELGGAQLWSLWEALAALLCARFLGLRVPARDREWVGPWDDSPRNNGANVATLVGLLGVLCGK
ncbi:hypothetical protein PYCCODRAFT_1094869 [Trametes coccinea BRFM310]|uniref:Uncharacterized protein n=1 Tax=Trametes coccinea (strain BRFM310) TaxID=1353009 RepID=A0A1Y2IYR5_TRAC3|nr:hypothetical protein PYCCODRAFT_1094869 [Trametes coccinea BRFM310]